VFASGAKAVFIESSQVSAVGAGGGGGGGGGGEELSPPPPHPIGKADNATIENIAATRRRAVEASGAVIVVSWVL
jgi:hypothetical protein